jgi:hypothetical protein
MNHHLGMGHAPRWGLRAGPLVPKSDGHAARRLALPRSVVIIIAIALLALIAGFLAFGGGNMGN